MGWFETAGKNISTAWSGFSAADTASSAGDGLSSAGSWAKNFAVETADAVVDWGAGYTKFALGAGSNLRIPYTDIPITPIGMAHDISNAIAPDSAMAKWMREGKEDASKYGEYAANNPADAAARPTQGVLNLVAKFGGFIGDVGTTIYDYHPIRFAPNLGIAAYNLGMEKDNKVSHWWGDHKFGDATAAAVEKVQVRNWNFLDMDEDTREIWEQPQMVDNKGLDNPYYRYQRNGLVAGEVGGGLILLPFGGAIVGRVAGFAYAGLGGTAGTARSIGTLSQLQKIETLDRALKVSSKIEKAAEKFAKATARADDLKAAGASAEKIAKAEAKVANAADNLTKTGDAVAGKLTSVTEKVKGKEITTQEAAYKEIKALEKAQDKLDVAKASGANAEKIVKLEEKVTKAEDAVTKKAARAENVGATPSDSLTRIDFASMSRWDNMVETSRGWGHKAYINTAAFDPRNPGMSISTNSGFALSDLDGGVKRMDNYQLATNEFYKAHTDSVASADGGNSLAALKERLLRVQQQQQNGMKTIAPVPEATLAEAPASLRVQFKSINEMPAAGEKGGYADIFRNSAEKPIVVIFTGLPQRDDNTQIPAALLQPPTSITQLKT